MSYDLIEITLSRLGELSPSFQSREAEFHQPADAIQNDDQPPLLFAEQASYRPVQRKRRSQRKPHEKDRVC